MAVAFDSLDDSAGLLELCTGTSSTLTVGGLLALWELMELYRFTDPCPGVVIALDAALVVVILDAGLVMLDDVIPADLPLEL